MWVAVPPAVAICALAAMAASSQSAAVTSAATDKIPAGIGCGPAAPSRSLSSLLLNVSMSTWETLRGQREIAVIDAIPG